MSQVLYHTILLIAGGVNLLIALALLAGNSDYCDYDVYRRSRQLSALCFAVFAVGFLLHAHFEWRTSWPEGATALTVTYFHCGAMLFGWSHTSLLRPDYLRSRIVIRDLIIYIIGVAAYWTAAVANPSSFILYFSYSVFFLHAGYIAFNFYRTYYAVRRSLLRMPADGASPEWWTREAKREVIGGHHSFVIGAHLIIIFGLGGIVVTVAFPTLLWPFTLLMAAGIAVFVYIFYSLTEYGRVIEAATCATEDAECDKSLGFIVHSA